MKEKYKQRRKTSQTPKKVRKVISKASERDKITSTRDIIRQIGVNKETVRTILKDGGFKYLSYKKRLVINEETHQNRLKQ